MEENPKPNLANHYDQAYKEDPKFFGGGKPEVFVLEASEMIPKDGQVIEFGAGQGRNAIPLAERGFSVKAIDISKVGVESMNRIAEGQGLSNFQAEVGDCRSGMVSDFDLIVSTFMLHHLSKEDAEKFIKEAQAHTKVGGINAIVTFTAEGDFARLPSAEGRFYPALGELKHFYEGWEIIKYIEEKSEAKKTKPDGGSMFNIKAEIIARKIKI